MITIRQLLNLKGNDLWTISPNATVYQGLELLAKHNIGALPVVENDQLVGMFSERDYARKVILKQKSSHNTLIKDLMTSKVYFLKPERTLDDCMNLFTDKHIRHLPVIDHGQLVGMITIGDVVKFLIKDQQNQIRDLEGYIAGSYIG
ncbi:MAG: CBS domain-containing protein [Bacteroidetes bacterium]|nr:CBS domain-containing protein [Calditrichota bacterium]MCB0837262.1 CBS domain-containing protein [Bacteroidota bacterium]MCB0847728.1 CBS domain-containing protein [Bacteroidota bacterium]